MLKPVQDTLTFEVLAWTPSTRGVIDSDVVSIVPPDRPTQEELNAYLDTVRTKVNGKIVLVGSPKVIPVTMEPAPLRLSDEQVRERFVEGKTPPRRNDANTEAPKPNALTGRQINEQLDLFMVANNVALRVNDAAMDKGMIRAFNNRTFDVTKAPPTVVMRNEDFGRIFRLLGDKTEVRLEFDIRNRSVPDGVTSYNVIGEITGTDKKDEVIMLGGHLDSWHAATGATDNAIGCAVMMEAARILKAIRVKPRRTIRVALWSGEEEGLLGSQAYVKAHFGSAENPGPEYGKFGGYFNIDAGTGRARGLSVFGPPETAAVLRDAVQPFGDLGIAGAVNTKSRDLGGSDFTSFNNAGLPGISVNQDPMEYFTTTWHTNLDTYERVIEGDVKNSAMVIAAAVYQLAMRDEMLPRFKSGELPTAPEVK
jgi:carboxypeptidase Q